MTWTRRSRLRRARTRSGALYAPMHPVTPRTTFFIAAPPILEGKKRGDGLERRALYAPMHPVTPRTTFFIAAPPILEGKKRGDGLERRPPVGTARRRRADDVNPTHPHSPRQRKPRTANHAEARERLGTPTSGRHSPPQAGGRRKSQAPSRRATAGTPASHRRSLASASSGLPAPRLSLWLLYCWSFVFFVLDDEEDASWTWLFFSVSASVSSPADPFHRRPEAPARTPNPMTSRQ